MCMQHSQAAANCTFRCTTNAELGSGSATYGTHITSAHGQLSHKESCRQAKSKAVLVAHMLRDRASERYLRYNMQDRL